MKTTKILIALTIVAAFAGSAEAASIYVDATNGCPGTGTFGDPYCDFAGATTAAGAGDTILAASGTYAETLLPPAVTGLTIVGNLSSRPHITGGAQLDTGGGVAGDGLTLRNLHFTGTPISEGFILALGVPSPNITIDNCLFDGENVALQHGVGSGNLTETVTVRNSEFKNILNWALFESRSGSGGGGSAMTDVLFENNFIHDSDGSIVFRGLEADYMDSVIVRNNTWDNIGGNGGNDYHWAAIEVNRAEDVSIHDNSVNDVVVGGYGEGQCFQVWNIPGSGGGTGPGLDMYNNCCTNTFQGVWLAIVGTGTDGAVKTKGSIHDNTFLNQSGATGPYGSEPWALRVSEGAPASSPFDVKDNYWGAADGPSGFGFTGSGGEIVDVATPGGAPAAEADASTFLTADAACSTAGVPAGSTMGIVLMAVFMLATLSLVAVVLRRRSARLTPSV